jgi:hypothetical protein
MVMSFFIYKNREKKEKEKIIRAINDLEPEELSNIVYHSLKKIFVFHCNKIKPYLNLFIHYVIPTFILFLALKDDLHLNEHIAIIIAILEYWIKYKL